MSEVEYESVEYMQQIILQNTFHLSSHHPSFCAKTASPFPTLTSPDTCPVAPIDCWKPSSIADVVNVLCNGELASINHLTFGAMVTLTEKTERSFVQDWPGTQ